MNSSYSKSRTVVWMVWIVASLFYAYQYILRVMPSIMLNDIMQQFSIDAATFGQFSGVYYIGYSLMHLPVGIMLDRFGPRRVMTCCILFTVVGLTPILFADHWIYPIIGRVLIGIGSSGAILGIFKIIRMTFSEKQFPRMLSLSVMIGLIGAIYGGGPVSHLCDLLGYKAVVQLFALGGLLLAAITYWIVPNMENSSQTGILSSVREVLGNARVILCCVFAGLMVGPLEGFADVWGALFLKQVYGFDSVVASSMPSLIFVGMCFGAPILSLIADKIGSHLFTIVGAGVVMTFCFSLLLAFQMTPTILSLSFMLVGVSSAYQILAIYKASNYVREEVAGLTTAVANMIIMIFGYAFHTIIGSIINSMGGKEVATSLEYGVAVIPIALVIGTVGFIAILFSDQRKRVAVSRTLSKLY